MKKLIYLILLFPLGASAFPGIGGTFVIDRPVDETNGHGDPHMSQGKRIFALPAPSYAYVDLINENPLYRYRLQFERAVLISAGDQCDNTAATIAIVYKAENIVMAPHRTADHTLTAAFYYEVDTKRYEMCLSWRNESNSDMHFGSAHTHNE